MTRDMLLMVLRQHEWNETPEETTCSSCGVSSFRSPHAKGCEMKAAIDWLESTAPGADLVFVYEPGEPGLWPTGPTLRLVRE